MHLMILSVYWLKLKLKKAEKKTNKNEEDEDMDVDGSLLEDEITSSEEDEVKNW